MQDKLVSAALLLAGLVHLLPAVGVLGAERLTALYGVTVEDPNLIVLLRHRAVLFGLLGALLVAAAFRSEWRRLALIGGLTSIVSFVALAWSTPECNDAIRRVALVDAGVLVLLLAAGARLAVVR